jgi:hypothetical protein
MVVTVVDNRVYVRLSRRNVRELSAMLDDPGARDVCLARRGENGMALVVHVEDDAHHYEGRTAGPDVGTVGRG